MRLYLLDIVPSDFYLFWSTQVYALWKEFQFLIWY